MLRQTIIPTIRSRWEVTGIAVLVNPTHNMDKISHKTGYEALEYSRVTKDNELIAGLRSVLLVNNWRQRMHSETHLLHKITHMKSWRSWWETGQLNIKYHQNKQKKRLEEFSKTREIDGIISVDCFTRLLEPHYFLSSRLLLAFDRIDDIAPPVPIKNTLPQD